MDFKSVLGLFILIYKKSNKKENLFLLIFNNFMSGLWLRQCESEDLKKPMSSHVPYMYVCVRMNILILNSLYQIYEI